MRDVKRYCGIILDDNRRKPICRLWFNASQKYLGLFDENRQEERLQIADVLDIYDHADRVRSTVARYLASE